MRKERWAGAGGPTLHCGPDTPPVWLTVSSPIKCGVRSLPALLLSKWYECLLPDEWNQSACDLQR